MTYRAVMKTRTRIKMCGTTNIDDALAAVEAGVDGLGFIFVAKSPRNVAPDKAQAIIASLPPFINTVGVFVDRPIEEVVEVANHCRLTHVQLHGREDRNYCQRLGQLCGCSLLKVFRIRPDHLASDFTPYNDVVKGFLLDTYRKGVEGGTGETFDWKVVNELNLQRPVFLAGGLTPEDIQQAIAAVHPFAVDINSGIEKEPGVKDHAKLRDLVSKVRLIDAE